MEPAKPKHGEHINTQMATTYTITNAGNVIVLRQFTSGVLSEVGFFKPEQINPIYADNAFRFDNGLEKFVVKLSETTYSTFAEFLAAVETTANASINALAKDATLTNGSTIVGGKMGEPVELTFTRPNNSNAYASNSVIATSTTAPIQLILDLATAGVPAGGSGYLTKLRALTNLNTFTGRLRLHLYRSAPTLINDGSPFTLLWANRSNRIGFIDLPAFNTGGAGSDAANAILSDLRFGFKLAPGETRLWIIIQNLDAPTPAANQQFFFSLLVDRN